MAIIGKIRKRSGLLVIIVGVALAAFVLGDFLKPNRRANRQYVNIGEVAGEDILGTDFNNKVEETLEIRRETQGAEALTPQDVFSIKQSIWQEMVSDIIMGKQYDKLGLALSVDELDALIRGNDPHEYIVQNFKDPQTGQFNPQSVNQFLQNFNQVDPALQKRYYMLENMIRTDQIKTKYDNLIAKGYYTPTQFAKDDYEEKNAKAVFQLVGIRYNTIPDSTIVTDEKDFTSFYNQHKDEYKQEASVDIEYLVFDVVPSAEDRKATAEFVNEAYEELPGVENIARFVRDISGNSYDSSWYKKGTLPVRIDSLMFNSPIGTIYGPYLEDEAYHIARLMDIQMRPDSMRASHILIAYQGARNAEDVTRNKQKAKEIADSLLNVVKRYPSRFEDLAVEFSDDPSVKTNKGDLDMFPDGMMIYPFNQAVVEGKVGDMVLAETLFGFHVIHITDKKDINKKVRVALIDVPIEASTETVRRINVEAIDFATTYSNEELFEQAVVDKGLNLRTAEKTGKLSNNIPGVEFPRQLVYWAFNDKTKKGDISPVLDMGNSFVVALLKEVYEEGPAPLEQIRENIKPLVLREKKAEILLNQIKDATSSGATLEQLAQRFNTQVDTINNITFGGYNIPGFGPEKEVIGTVFGLKPGEMSKPIKGTQGVYVLVLEEFIAPPARNDNYEQQKNFLSNSMQSRVNREVYNALEKKTEVVDNRLMYY